MLDSLTRDLRFAARGLRRSPGFTAAAVLTLALGIGATTAVFSVVYGIVFRPLPFPNADRLVRVVQVLPERPGGPPSFRAGISPSQITEWRATSRTLAEIGFGSPRPAVLTGAGDPVRLTGAHISVSLFRALGVPPHRGRIFLDDDEQPGQAPVVILSHRTWRTRFGASEEILGRTIALNEQAIRVVGVMPEGFGFPSVARSMLLNAAGDIADAPEFWTPFEAQPRSGGPPTGGATLVVTYALLRPGVTLEEATAEVNTLMPMREGARDPIELVNARVEQARAVRPTLLLFQAAVLFVLFIACVNVVNLLLARGASRRHEMAIRRALGASPAQLARYAVAEGTVVGIAGGALGVLLAHEIVDLFRALPPFLLPRMADVRVDGFVLGAAAALSIGSGLAVGLVSAIRTVRGDSGAGSMTWQSRTASAGPAQRPSRVLLVAEVAAGVVLLAGAGLLLNSFVRLTSVDRGFDPADVYTFRVSLPASYPPGVRRAFHETFADTLRAMPGVTSIGAFDYLPGRGSIGRKTAIDGESRIGPVAFNMLAPGVFETLRIPLRGRDFTARDRAADPSVAIVSETFARQFFPGDDPLGRRIDFQNWQGLTIVGVAADTRMLDVTARLDPAIYLPERADGALPGYVVRAASPALLAADIRAAAVRLDPNAVVFDAVTMETLLARMVASPKLYSATATGFALVAVALAALGLYGVLAYSVGMRTREFGIRITLGALPGSLIRGVMRDAAGAVLPGLAVGILGALYLSRFLESLLFGVQPRDPATFAAVALLFLAVAGLACYLPARRATQVDPVVALRAE
jgi:putative ABC transport system permease protein